MIAESTDPYSGSCKFIDGIASEWQKTRLSARLMLSVQFFPLHDTLCSYYVCLMTYLQFLSAIKLRQKDSRRGMMIKNWTGRHIQIIDSQTNSHLV